MSVLIKLRRGLASQWTSQNIVLASGEPGYELDTGRLKIGNGITAWNSLQYASVIPSGFVSGSGINISSGTNGATITIGVSGLSVANISGLNEAIDDRIGSGLFVAGTGINLNYNDSSNTFTVSVTGLINNPTDNRLLTSRDNTTTGIDAESNLTFDGSLLSISGNLIAKTGTLDIAAFNTSNGAVSTQGQIGWNNTEGTVDIAIENNVAIQINQHRILRIRNTTGTTLYKGQVVYASGVHPNGIITPNLYIADGSIEEIRFIGMMLADVNINNNGFAIDFGHVNNIDTRGNVATNYAVGDETWADGDILYVHPTVSGKLTKVEPKHSISVAYVLDAASNGKIFVRPTNFGDLNYLHDVNTSGATNGQFLQYNSVTDYWVPSSSGNFTSLSVNGTGVSISGHTHTASQITDFNEAVDDRIGSGLFVAGTGIDLSYVDASGSFTVSVTGLISSPANNRILTSRDSTTTGIDAESNLTFDGTTLSVSGDLNVSSSGIFDTIKINKFYHNNLSVATGVADSSLLITIVDPTGTPSTQVISGSGLRNSLLNQPAVLRFRQGTEAERLLITPASGEPIWVTNTNKFYIGDGTTVGGLIINGGSGVFTSLEADNLKLDGNTLSSTSGVIIISPSGSQAIQASSSGNSRGNYAVDLQRVRSANTQVASANYSTILNGKNNTASTNYSIAAGQGNDCSGGTGYTVAIGLNNTVNGFAHCAIGYNNTIGGYGNNFAFGGNNTLSSYASYSCAIGNNNDVTGPCSVAFGGSQIPSGGNTVSGGYSICAGTYNTISAGYSVCAGSSNTITFSGGTSVAFGGNNTVSGQNSCVIGGFSNNCASHYSSILGGNGAKTNKLGEIAHAMGNFSSAGDAQHSILVARKTTTTSTANQVMFLDDTSARLTIPAKTTWTFEVKLSAYNDTDSAGAGWIFRGAIRRNGAGGTALIGSVIEENWKDSAMSSTSASIVADDLNDALEIRVTGLTSKNIRWVAVVDISQVSYGTP